MSNDIEKNCKNYSNFVKIGFGLYSIVYRAKNKRNGSYVAIKEIIKKKYNNSKEFIKNEVEIMNKLKNENSVKLIEIIESTSYFYIVMEYCEYNLQNYLDSKRNTPLSINEIKIVLTQLNNTFKIMFKENLIHRDLKFNNILISLDYFNNNIIKLCDYGATKELSNSMTLTETPLTIAPEVLQK